MPCSGKITVLQNRLEGGQCGQEKPHEEGTLQETWREMVHDGGLRKEGELDSPQQQQRRGQQDPHGSGFQDVERVAVAKKKTMCVTSRGQDLDVKGFPDVQVMSPLCGNGVCSVRLSSEMSGLGSDVGSDLGFPSLPPGP